MRGPAILSRTYAALPIPGEIVETDDGQRWFHPYTGAAPSRLADNNKRPEHG